MSIDTDPQGLIPPSPGGPPPLFAVLHQALQNRWRGSLRWEAGDGEIGDLSVLDGRVIALQCRALTPSALVDLMIQAGVMDQKSFQRLERRGRPGLLDPLTMALERGLLSRGILGAVRESVARETLLRLLLDRSLRVQSTSADLPGPGGRDLNLPIPFLLKEAHRRHQEMPTIRQLVTGPDQVFVRTQQGSGGIPALSWEDLPLSPGEKQVFFFVDGKRSVADLALATCQSEHLVGRSLAALHGAGLVRPLSPREASRNSRPDPVRIADRNSMLRLFLMLVSLCLLLLGIHLATVHLPAPALATQEDPFRTLIREAPRHRLEAAKCLFWTRQGSFPEDFDSLRTRGLVLPSDRKAALSSSMMPPTETP